MQAGKMLQALMQVPGVYTLYVHTRVILSLSLPSHQWGANEVRERCQKVKHLLFTAEHIFRLLLACSWATFTTV